MAPYVRDQERSMHVTYTRGLIGLSEPDGSIRFIMAELRVGEERLRNALRSWCPGVAGTRVLLDGGNLERLDERSVSRVEQRRAHASCYVGCSDWPAEGPAQIAAGREQLVGEIADANLADVVALLEEGEWAVHRIFPANSRAILADALRASEEGEELASRALRNLRAASTIGQGSRRAKLRGFAQGELDTCAALLSERLEASRLPCGWWKEIAERAEPAVSFAFGFGKKTGQRRTTAKAIEGTERILGALAELALETVQLIDTLDEHRGVEQRVRWRADNVARGRSLPSADEWLYGRAEQLSARWAAGVLEGQDVEALLAERREWFSDAPERWDDGAVREDLRAGNGTATALSLMWATQETDAAGFIGEMQARLLAGRSLSIAQTRGIWNVIRAAVAREREEREQTARGENGTSALGGIARLLAELDERIQRPKLALQKEDGTTAWLSVAGERARYPGSINVTSSRHFGGDWYGRIVDGNPDARLRRDAALMSALDRIEADPSIANAVAGHAVATSRCIVCSRVLEDDESARRGAGQTCARRLGLVDHGQRARRA